MEIKIHRSGDRYGGYLRSRTDGYRDRAEPSAI